MPTPGAPGDDLERASFQRYERALETATQFARTRRREFALFWRQRGQFGPKAEELVRRVEGLLAFIADGENFFKLAKGQPMAQAIATLRGVDLDKMNLAIAGVEKLARELKADPAIHTALTGMPAPAASTPAGDPAGAPEREELARGLACHEAGDHAKAEQVLQAIPQGSPVRRDARLALCRVLVALDRPAEGLHCALEADGLSRDEHSVYQMGMCLMALEKHEDARTMFERALTCNPGYVEAHVMLGHARRALGDPAAALAAYEEALQRDDTHAGARFFLAELLLERQEYPRAITQLHYLLKANPDYGPAYLILGDIAFLHQDYRQAAVEYVRAHTLNAADTAMLYRLGQAFGGIGDPYQAVKAYDRVIRDDRTFWEAHLAAATVCEQEGWFNRARRYYDALLYVQEHRTEAYKGLARVEAGIARTGLAGIDPAGAPEDTYEYLQGPFVAPEVLAPEDAAAATPRSQTAELPPPPRAGRTGRDAYSVGSEAASYLADFVAEPPAPPPAAPPPAAPARRGNTGMLDALQKRLREKIEEKP